jgi:hypothetical protein
VEKGYPVLARQQTSGLRFLDATRLFDREPSPVYMDDCCHYTARGNQLLAASIAQHILTSDASARR